MRIGHLFLCVKSGLWIPSPLGAGECTALRLVGGVRTMLRAAFLGELDHHRIRTAAIVTLPGSNRV